MKKQNILRKEQGDKDSLAVALSTLLGANVVKKADYDKLLAEKQNLLAENNSINELKSYLIVTYCKLEAFINYHSKWKPTTRKFEKKLSKLKKEKLYVEFDDFPVGIADNLKEAYNCYINGLPMACYIMILRTIELIVNHLYDLEFPKPIAQNGKLNFIPVSKKLIWANEKGIIRGADYSVAKAFIEARNESVHSVYVPTNLQILSAFDTVLRLLAKTAENFGLSNNESLRNVLKRE